eukprot:CFRG5768T1
MAQADVSYLNPKEGTSNAYKQVTQFSFQDRKTDDHVTINIPQSFELGHENHVWPCASLLAKFVWSRRAVLSGKRVIELGAGVALPGQLAAFCGATVALTDVSEGICRKSVRLNPRIECNVNVHTLKWGCFNSIQPIMERTTSAIESAPSSMSLRRAETDVTRKSAFRIILAADCLYEASHYEDFISTVSYLIGDGVNESRGCSQVEAWMTYNERGGWRRISSLLRRWALKATHVPIRDFTTAQERRDNERAWTGIQLYILTRKIVTLE